MESETTRSAVSRETETARGLPAYLTGVQGLRTVAALLVAVYHIWFGRVSGGVDVFFVVAGYFAVKSLHRLGTVERSRERFGMVCRYWLRTARRVVPSAALVVLATIVAAVFWMPQSDWGRNLWHAAASLLFLENWQLIASGTDYLQRGLAASPFQQFWALSLQVQFYAAIPLVVLAGVALAQRRGWALRRTLIVLLGALAAASFMFSFLLTATNQPVAYFHSATRAWEFLVGGLLALLLTRGLKNRVFAGVLGWGGLTVLVLLGAIVDVSALFPGAVALIPVLAAVAVIVSSASGYDPYPLRATPVVRFGDASFAFYLWHWPILVFYRYQFGEQVGLLGGVAILVLSAALAYGTTRFVEMPVRNWALLQRSALATVLACLLICAPAVSALAWWRAELRSAETQAATQLEAARTGATPEGELVPAPAVAREDIVDAYAEGCHQDAANAEVRACDWGDADAPRTIAVVGGSHSAQWIDAARKVAEEADANVVSMTKSGCLFGEVERFANRPSQHLGGIDENDFDPSCMVWAERVLDALIADPPDLVLTIATRKFERVDEVPSGYTSYFAQLAEHGIPVLGVRDNPWFAFDPPECVEGGAPEECGMPRAEFYAADIEEQLPDLPGFVFVDIADELCSDDWCPVVDDNVLIYRDFNHLTTTWTLRHGEAVREALRSQLAEASSP